MFGERDQRLTEIFGATEIFCKCNDRSVLEALSLLNDDRKCYRLVGGVLVERTKAQVVPAVQENVQSV